MQIESTYYACDVCNNTIGANKPGGVTVILEQGSRDVDPTTATIHINYDQPYSSRGDDICDDCFVEIIRKYTAIVEGK